jgi:hypothetical protein
VYSKIINYTISYVAKSDTKIKLSEILECSEAEAEPLLNLFIIFVTYFSKFRAGEREFKANLEVIKLSDQKKEIFTSKLKENQNELRKKLGLLGNDITPVYKDLKWRFDV